MFNLPLGRQLPSSRQRNQVSSSNPSHPSGHGVQSSSSSASSSSTTPKPHQRACSSSSSSSESITPTPSGVTTPRPSAIPDPPLLPDPPTRPEAQLALPTHLLRLKASAQTLYQTAHYNAAIEIWRHILGQLPPTAEFAYERAIIYANISAGAIANKEWEVVVDTAGSAVDLRPGWGRAWARLVKGTVGGVLEEGDSGDLGEVRIVERRVEGVLRMQGVRWARGEKDMVESELERVREALRQRRRDAEALEVD